MTYGSVSRVDWMLFVALLVGGCSPKSGTGDAPACPSFKACGGLPDGSWQLDSVCLDADVSGAFSAQWPQPSCRNAITSSTLSMTGTLTFASGSSTWNVTTSQTWRGIYSIACMSEIQGAPVAEADRTQCYVQQGWLAKPGIFSSVECAILDQNCDCNMSYSGTNTSTVPYTIQEATLSFSDATPPAAFCADGDTLMLRQADSLSGLPLIIDAHRI
jgi:hypothetical protein